MYQSVKQFSQQNYRMPNIQLNGNHHSQVTQHLDGKNVKSAPLLPTIDEDQISTYSDTSMTLSSLSDSSDTSIVPCSPSPSDNKSVTPSTTFLTQFIPNMPFNITPFFNYNVSNLHWSANNYTLHSNQFPFISDTTVHNITEHETNDKKPTKTSIYIPRETIEFINRYCIESFHTHQQNDMGLFFAHVKESNGMQINDKQIHIHNTYQGKIIISNIDLHFYDGKVMYLIGMANEIKFQERTPWKIVTIMRAETIHKQFGITQDKLPISSRNMKYFIDGLNVTPEYVSKSIISKTNFKKLCKKESKTKNKIKKIAVNISEHKLKYYCRKSWNNGKFLPVVVIKGGQQWIEWKKFVRIFDNKLNGNEQWVGISLRYYSSYKKWQIECMDYDAGRVFYQFRLVGDNHNYCYSYNDLKQLINTTLNIF